MTGMDKDGVRKSAEENALKQVRLNLALTAIVEAEGLEASEDETEAEYQKVAEQYGLKVEDVKKRLMKEDVESEVKTRKAVAVVADSATATKPEPKEEPKTEEAPAQEDSAEDGEKPAAKKPARKPAAKKTPKADKPEADEAAETK
jgi:trigger factor